MKNNYGFSLVELSIVLVILGLLTGGILAGQNLIRASELRSVSVQINQINTAFMTFRDKYFALPGDMRNAQDFWGVQNATPATCKTTASNSALTCNGDGNGQIQYSATGANETFRAWQQLANAGLIEGSYTGVKRNGATDERETDIGVNVPRARMDQVGFLPTYFGDRSADSNWYDGFYGNILLVGKPYSNFENWEAFLAPEEMWNLDTKMDDGRPAYGTIRVTTPNWPPTANCTTSPTESVAEYNFTQTGQECNMIVITKF